MRSATDGSRVSPRTALAGAALLVLLAAVIIPSAAWVSFLAPGADPVLDPLLTTGARLLRLSLCLLASLVIVGVRAGWWTDEVGDGARATPHASRREAIMLAVILAVALILRLVNLDSDLWIDEIFTLTDLDGATFRSILAVYPSQNQHFLYALLAHPALLALGEGAVALRLPSVLFGVASIGAVYLFAREVSDHVDGILSAALLTLSYYHIWYSQSARGYTALLFWTLVASWLFLRTIDRPTSPNWALYAIAAALGAFSHQTMVFVVATHFLIFVAHVIGQRSAGRARSWLPVFSGFGLCAALTLTLHAMALPQILGPGFEDTPIASWKSVWWTVRETTRGLAAASGGPLALAVGGGVLVAGCAHFWRRRPAVVWLMLVPPILVGIAMMVADHPLWPRYFFFVAGFGALIAVRGLRIAGSAVAGLVRASTSARRKVGIAFALAALVATAYSARWVYAPKQDFTGARDFVNETKGPADAVAAVGLAAHAYGRMYAPEWATAETYATFDRIRRSAPRTWVVFTLRPHMQAFHPDILATIDEEFVLVRGFYGTMKEGTVFVYVSDDASHAAPDGALRSPRASTGAP